MSSTSSISALSKREIILKAAEKRRENSMRGKKKNKIVLSKKTNMNKKSVDRIGDISNIIGLSKKERAAKAAERRQENHTGIYIKQRNRAERDGYIGRIEELYYSMKQFPPIGLRAANLKTLKKRLANMRKK